MDPRDTADTTATTTREPLPEYLAPALEVMELTDAIGVDKKPRGSGFVPSR